MTPQAAIVAAEARMLRRFRIERVEENALLRIDAAQLQHAVPHESDRGVVAEVNRARRRGADMLGLDVGFRKNEDLRIDADAELFENRRQIPPSVRRAIELHLTTI